MTQDSSHCATQSFFGPSCAIKRVVTVSGVIMLLGPMQSQLLGLQTRLPCTGHISGLQPEIGKNGPKTWILALSKKGGRIAEKWENWPKNGPNPFSAIFSHFGPEGRNGVCTGQSGLQTWAQKPV